MTNYKSFCLIAASLLLTSCSENNGPAGSGAAGAIAPAVPGTSPPTSPSPPPPTAPNNVPLGQSPQDQEAQFRASRQRLKALGRAFLAFHNQNKSFPPAYVADAEGKPLYSWRVLMLPYLGHAALYERFDKTKSWDAPENSEISNTAVDAFKSPADATVAVNGTNYLVVIGEQTLFPGVRPTKIPEVLDGLAHTVAVVELTGVAGSWAAPIDLRQDELKYELGSGSGQFQSPYPRGVQLLTAETSVVFITEADLKTWLPSALTRAGNEIIDFK